MKSIVPFSLIVSALTAACLIVTSGMAQENSDDPFGGVEAAKPATDVIDITPPVNHIVLLKFKEDAPEEEVDQIVAAFVELKNEIDEIAHIEWGTDMSPEKLSKGYTHCFRLVFATAEDRDTYLPHPAHKAFGKILRPQLEDVLVVDYVPQGDE